MQTELTLNSFFKSFLKSLLLTTILSAKFKTTLKIFFFKIFFDHPNG